MSIRYVGDEHNAASGTREAFAAFSDDLVAAGLPPVVVVSADREPEVQVAIFVDRFRQQASGGGRFGDVRWWDGSAWGYPGGTRWVRVSAEGTVAVPGTGNHEKRRSDDLAWPYNSDTWQHARAREIAKRHNITCDGIGFGEWWHWTFWGALGVIGSPASTGTTAPIPKEWDEMATPEQIRAETKQALRELLNEAGENAPQAVQNITFLAGQANGWIDDKRPREGQLALAISRVTEILHAVDGVADPRIIGADGQPVVRALAAFLRSRPDAPSSGVVDVDEQAIVAGVLAGLAQNQQLLLDAIDALPAETIAALRTALGSAV